MYHPIDDDWQHRLRERLVLVYYWLNGVIPGGPAILLTLPNMFKSVFGDGNCLYFIYFL